MAGWMILLLFFVLQIVGTAVAMWLLAAMDGRWWPFGPRYHYVGVMDGTENRSVELPDSAGGADRVSDVVRSAQHDGLKGSDRVDSYVQRASAEGERGGDGAAAPEHRESGSLEGRRVQGTGSEASAGSFRAELERRWAELERRAAEAELRR